MAGKGRLHPARCLSGFEGEAVYWRRHRSVRGRHRQQKYQEPGFEQRSPPGDDSDTYQEPFSQQQQSSSDYSDIPISENGSEATLTDSTRIVRHKGCLLGSAPPDVPPRNRTMSLLKGRPGGLVGSVDREDDFEPSRLARTPSGNVYILTDIPIKKSPLDDRSNLSCSSLFKIVKNHQQKNFERRSLTLRTPVPVFPVSGHNLRRPNLTRYPPTRFHFRKRFIKCSWKRTAILFIIFSVVLLAAVAYMLGTLCCYLGCDPLGNPGATCMPSPKKRPDPFKFK